MNIFIKGALKSLSAKPQIWARSETAYIAFFFLVLLKNVTIIYLFICLCRVLVEVCGIYLPDQGWNLGPLHWQRRVLATGPPGKSLNATSFFNFRKMKQNSPRSQGLGYSCRNPNTIFFFFLVPLCDLQYLSSSTRDQTWASGRENPESELRYCKSHSGTRKKKK